MIENISPVFIAFALLRFQTILIMFTYRTSTQRRINYFSLTTTKSSFYPIILLLWIERIDITRNVSVVYAATIFCGERPRSADCMGMVWEYNDHTE